MDNNENTQITLDNIPLNGTGIADFLEVYNLYTAQPQVKSMLVACGARSAIELLIPSTRKA